MSAPLLSNAWYRVAQLKPALRSHARLHRHRYRGEVWYLLQDTVSNRVHRFTPAARLLIAALDGKRTVQQLWELANQQLADDAPTQDEVINLLGQLHNADMLLTDVSPDVQELFERAEREQTAQQRRSYMNPMAIRIPLWDPEAFLNRFAGVCKLLWNQWGALLWLLLVLPAVFMLPSHWDQLTHNFSDQVLALDNLLLLWLAFPLIKALHELGHAAAIKAGGGEVHEMGLIFLVLMPVPYVDASAATAFKSKYERAVVGAAGMAVELVIAALAFYLWTLVEPGLLSAMLFNTMLVAGVSTLFFNGNPLLRYDAYYILADLIEIPNLAKKSLNYWTYLLNNYVYKVEDVDKPQAKPGEKAWFLFYGPASMFYRIWVALVIALFVAGQFFFIGVLLAIWAIIAMLCVPLFKGVKYLFDSPTLVKQRKRALTLTGSFVALVALFLLLVPMPFHTTTQGVVWLDEQAMVRAETDGFVAELVAKPDSRVVPGQLLIQIQDPQLQARLAYTQARVNELEAAYASERVYDQVQAEIVREQLQAEKAILARAQQKIDGLQVKAGAAGRFVVPEAEKIAGRYFRKGALLGYVIGDVSPQIKVVVDQDTIDVVNLGTTEVQIRHAHQLDHVLAGEVIAQAPAGIAQLPSRALATQGGGAISTDPKDPKGEKAMQRLFQFDIGLPQYSGPLFFGERVYVRFSHHDEPLAVQWYRGVRSIFLAYFEV